MRKSGSSSPEASPERRDGERSEPSQSEGDASATPRPTTQVHARPTRRTFTAAYKLDIVSQADACRAPGEIGALLRREGLYSGHLSKWRIQRKQGALSALSARRGPKGASAESREVEQLRKELARVRRRLEQAELCLEIQKKASQMLGIPLNPPPRDEIDS